MSEFSLAKTIRHTKACSITIDTRGAFPDPRVKVVMAIALSTMLFMTAGKLTMIAIFGVALAVLLAAGMYRTGIKFLALFAALSLVDFTILQLGWVNVLTAMLSFFIYMVLKFLPMFMMGSWVVSTVRVNDFVMALQNSGVPGAIVIPLAAMLRFMPTVKDEAGYITDTMKMRNIELSVRGLLLHPLKSMEYVMVPLLLRSVKVADEIAAAALTRGIDRPNRRSSLRDVRLTAMDIVIAAVFCSFIVGLWYCDKAVIPGLVIERLLH